MYLIDKVVRMRGKDGRFGVDHSEILNYELEIANKARDEHMNYLVYKDPAPYAESPRANSTTLLPPDDTAKQTSQVLFKRLKNKGPVSTGSRISLLESKRSSSVRSVHTDRGAPTFQQWVRGKDAERRLKKKLVAESKREIRTELLGYAKREKLMHDSRVNTMEEWLIRKKLNEAYKVTQHRNVSRQDEIDREAQDQLARNNNTKSYKMWMTQRSMQERFEQMERARIAQM